jgi:hypothetical protein
MLYHSPLRSDGYKVLVLHSGAVHDKTRNYPFSPFHIMLAYRFSVAPDTRDTLVSWELTSASPVGQIFYPGPGESGASYAGYSVEEADQAVDVIDLRRTRPGTRTNLVVLETKKGYPTAVSGYSHACLHLRDSSLVMSYYL